MAPLPVTIGVPLETTRSSWSLIKIVAGLIQALGAGLQIAVPPLAEPGLAAAQGGADLLDGAAGEAETDGTLTRGEFVVHGALRGVAAGGCPRRAVQSG